jgi:hypothetical protein
MFERNRVDNSLQQASVPAEITLGDGRILKGKFHISAARSIYDVLNGETAFLDFESHGGDRAMIAKSRIATVKIVAVSPANGLQNRLRAADDFDPHGILGVAKGASWRGAYVRLSKVYHPDLFAGVALPAEVRDYLSGMSRRINAAYAALEEPQHTIKRAAIEKAKPVYVSPSRV